MITIQILGMGCPKCEKLTALAEQAARELGIEYRIEKVKDLKEIMKFSVMRTPALAVDGQVKVAGRIPTPEELKGMLAP